MSSCTECLRPETDSSNMAHVVDCVKQ